MKPEKAPPLIAWCDKLSCDGLTAADRTKISRLFGDAPPEPFEVTDLAHNEIESVICEEACHALTVECQRLGLTRPMPRRSWIHVLDDAAFDKKIGAGFKAYNYLRHIYLRRNRNPDDLLRDIMHELGHAVGHLHMLASVCPKDGLPTITCRQVGLMQIQYFGESGVRGDCAGLNEATAEILAHRAAVWLSRHSKRLPAAMINVSSESLSYYPQVMVVCALLRIFGDKSVVARDALLNDLLAGRRAFLKHLGHLRPDAAAMLADMDTDAASALEVAETLGLTDAAASIRLRSSAWTP